MKNIPFKNRPIITENTIMLDEPSQKVIKSCKKAGNYLEGLKACVADITGMELQYVDYGAMYHWLRETYRQLGKIDLLITLLDNAFSPVGINASLYEKLNFHERFLSIMCSELCALKVAEYNENDILIALVDLRAVYN